MILEETAALYNTYFGKAYCANSLEILQLIPDNSIDLIFTSPPFALTRKKAYDNMEPEKYQKWFEPFAIEFYRILKDSGSLVLHLGGSWVKGKPIKTLYNYKILIYLCENLHFNLAQDFFWYNKAKLPGPAQWVNVKRIRVKDAVEPIWWLSKTTWPKANNKNILKEYSDEMKKLLSDPTYYKPNVIRPSEHRISKHFYKNNGGAIPPNIFNFSNTDSQSNYMRKCRENEIIPHPARFPIELPLFFIQFLTIKGDLVLDPFAGSNTTGEAAEKLERKWISIEISQDYLEASKYRFHL